MEIKFGNRTIGLNHPTYFIADIAANHDGDFDAEAVDILNFSGDIADDLRINAEALVSHQSFAAEFQQDSVVVGCVIRFVHVAC